MTVFMLVSVSVCVCARANTHTPPTLTTYLLIALAALISVCRCMRAGAGWFSVYEGLFYEFRKVSPKVSVWCARNHKH